MSDPTPAPAADPTPAPTPGGGILDAQPPVPTPAPLDPTPSDPVPADPQWYDGLSEEVTSHKGYEGLKGKIQNVDALAFSYLNLQSKIGSHEEGGIKPISADSTPEELTEFYNANGRPLEAGDYKFDGLPEGMELDSEKLTERNAGLHQLGLSQSQYEGVMGMHIAEVNSIQDNLQQNQANIREATETALNEKWGADYDKNVKSVAAVADRFGIKDDLIKSGVVNQQFIMEMLHQVHLSTSEDGIVKSKDSGYNRADEKKLVMQQLRDLPRNHPDRDALQRKQVELSR
jgi:hypothetical protein